MDVTVKSENFEFIDNQLADDDTKLNVELNFRTIDDFNPAEVVKQVEPLRKLFDARQRLMDLLAKLDRASMAVGLEARVPLLDHRVVELAWRLPRRFKVRGGEGKWILRRILHRHVPAELVERPKMGFSVPVGDWLRGPLRPWAEDLLAADSLRGGMLDPVPVRAAWADVLAGRGRAELAVWAVLVFQAWHARWTRGAPEPAVLAAGG